MRSRFARVAAAVAPTVALLVLFELGLRAFPHRLPVDVGIALHSVYGEGPGDIYFRDRPTRSRFLWPDFETQAYWNGYLWQHRTDELGFRNPEGLADRSLVLLGDSMIYGHGVDEEDTVAHFLRSEHGLGAYNAGRQGDTLYQEYLVARILLPRLRPKTLALTVFLNDFEDVEIYRTPQEIASPPELALDVDALVARLDEPERSSKWSKQLHRFKLWRLVQFVWQRARSRSGGEGEAPATRELSSFLSAITDDARFAPVARYYETLIADLARRAREQGTELVLLQLDVGDHFVPGAIAAQDRVRSLLESIGKQNQLRVLTTRSVFAGCSECFLLNDGHLRREGHRRLAALLAAELAPPRS